MKRFRCMLSITLAVLGMSFAGFAQLSGTKTVGTGGAYATLGAAIADLNTNGVNGPVVLSLTDAAYTETGASLMISIAANAPTAVNTVTIKPAAGVTPTITVSGCVNTGTNAYSALTIANTSFITIDGSNLAGGTTKDLTISMNDATYGRNLVYLYGNCDNITIKNCKLSAAAIVAGTTANPTQGISVLGQTTGVADNLVIQNNQIFDGVTMATYGITVQGYTTTPVACTNVVVKNNTVNCLWRAIHYYYVGSTGITSEISGNTLSAVSGPSGFNVYGIYLRNQGGTLNIFNNRFGPMKLNTTVATSSLFGIATTSSIAGTVVNIYNNIMSDFSSASATGGGIYGMYLGQAADQNTYNVSFNTIQIAPASAIPTPAVGIRVASTLNAALKNNIIVNSFDNAASYALYQANTGTFVSNYNDLSVPTVNGNIGYTTAAKKTIADWRSAAGQDSASVTGAPQFLSASDLHINPNASPVSAASNAGTPVAGVTTDIDGDGRDALHPDIGADEFTAISAVKAPVLSVMPASLAFGTVTLKTSKLDSVTVKNTGTDSLFIASIAAGDSAYTVTPASARLDTGTTKKFYVTFRPATLGTHSSVLVFTSNASSAKDTVKLSGTAAAPKVPVFTATPGSLTFRNVLLNVGSKDSITVKNTGTDSLIISQVSSSDASVTITPTSARLDTSASVKFYITYKTAVFGTKSTVLIFTANTPELKDSVKVTGSTVTVLAIGDARKDANADLIADYSVTKDTMLVYGVITSPNYSTTGTSYFMQDATGGIDVFSSSANPTPIAEGDSVFVVGYVAQYRGLTELTPLAMDSVHFGVIKHNVVVPAPKRLSLPEFASNPEKYEGQLIEIDSLFKSSGSWPAAGANASIYVKNRTKADSIQLFFDLDTDIDGSTEMDFPLNVTGIVSQYTSSTTVYNNGYELMPRRLTDMKHVIIAGVAQTPGAELPKSFDLANNYPNPFNPSTLIRFALPEQALARLTVFDMVGREVRMLVNRTLGAGYFEASWDGRNDAGMSVASGLYIYRLEAGSYIASKKMMLLK